MMSASFFYWLIGLSFVFATVSAMIYLKKNQLLSFDGLKKKKGYLSVLYGTTISINLLLFMVIFPLVSNIANASSADDAQLGGLRNTTFKVKIPCPGHSPLISESLRNVDGVEWLRFRFPNYFDVRYDSKKTSTSDLLALDVFDSYPALVVSESVS